MDIGKVKIEYSMDGTVAFAIFTPALSVQADDKLLNKLSSIPNTDQDYIAKHANIIFATWFSRINEIELSDRSEYHIVNQVVSCEQYPGGAVKMCEILFKFEPIK